MWAEELSTLPFDDVIAAIEEVGNTPRRQGESAIPDYGVLKLLIEEKSHPLRHLRRIVRKLARSTGTDVDADLFELFEEAAGHRTDADLDKAYIDLLKFNERGRMPTPTEFLRACGIPKVYRNGTKPQD